MKPNCTTALCLFLTTSVLLADDKTTATQPQSEILKKVFMTEPAGKPAAIHKARTVAKPGDTLTLKGRVMGNIKPFVEGRSIFILGDTETLKACSDIPGDACATPWDNCCDSPEAIKQGTATIQVMDARGKVLKEGIENVNGLKKLSHVIVSGTVAPGSSPALLLLNAEAIKVEAPKKD